MKHVLALFLAALAAAPAAAQVSGQVIYGSDDRLDVYQVKDSRLKTLADSTAALFSSDGVSVRGGRAELSLKPYGPSYSLCQGERFYDQSYGAFCSGSLVAPDVIMTAGHCLVSEDICRSTKFVFGFAIKKEGEATPASVPAGDVYGCKKLIDRDLVVNGADWALIRLDRPVTGHKPLKLNLTGAIANKTPVVVIGHPDGLPTKIAGGANVRDNSPADYFVANLDTYDGNSGSAVFNAETGLIEGILVRGEQDYVERDGCKVSNVCADDACRGEEVTRISLVAPKLPAAGRRARVAQLGPAFSALLSAAEGAAPRRAP